MCFFWKKIGIEPKDIKDLARVDMVNDQVEDIRNAYVRMIYRDYVSVTSSDFSHWIFLFMQRINYFKE